MSTFKAGDRVRNKVGKWLGTVVSVGVGSPHAMGGAGTMRVQEDGEPVRAVYHCEYFDLIAPAPPVAVAPTLETATGAELDRIAAWKQRTADVVRAVAAGPGVTQAEWSEAIARINAQHRALDTVRVWLSSHSLESTTRQCQKEAREVMAVVLAALDAERAGQ